MNSDTQLLDRPNTDRTPVDRAWKMNAGRLATWTLAKMVNRDDAYGKYYPGTDGKFKSCKEDGKVDCGLIHQHFAENRIIGLYSTSKDDTCRWLTIDIDRHDGEPEEYVERNERFARHLY